jgi:hypothetical protein
MKLRRPLSVDESTKLRGAAACWRERCSFPRKNARSRCYLNQQRRLKREEAAASTGFRTLPSLRYDLIFLMYGGLQPAANLLRGPS